MGGTPGGGGLSAGGVGCGGGVGRARYGSRMPEIPASPPLALDASQRLVVELPPGAGALVVGAAGAGKTTVLVELAARRVREGALVPSQLLVLAAGRHQADALRERMAQRIPVVTTGPWARTAASVAFEAVRERALLEGASPPRLLSGAEHDLAIRDVLEGGAELGTGPAWPAHLDETVRGLPGFRTELRELMMRATEYGITPHELVRLGERHERPAWVAAGGFMAEYGRVIAQSHEGLLDSAELAVFAERAVADGVAGERLSGVRLVLVDDVQQASEGTLRLLAAFAGRGAEVVAFGDPDLAANTFRGAGAETVGRFRELVLPAGAPELVLERVHRHGPGIRRIVRQVTEMVGTAGITGQRRAQSAAPAESEQAEPEHAAAEGLEPAMLLLQPSAWTLRSAIGRELRERHVFDGVPWGELAVIVRSRSDIPALERQLATAQVPTRSSTVGRPLREHPEAAALLRLVEHAIGRRLLDAGSAAAVLLGPYGGLDPVGLRRLRLAVRSEAIAHDDHRPAGELLAEALGEPAGFATIDHAVGREAARLARVLARVGVREREGASAEELLWEAWDGSGVAEPWRRAALGTGVAAEEASRALDGVVALFAAARRFAENRPASSARDFFAELLDAEVPSDVIAPQTASDAVLVTTPSGAVGAEFDTVVVAGLQDGRWPDLRVRGSLLGAPALVEVATGVDPRHLDERRAVLGDELRLLAVALSRARRRVLLAAVSAEDEAPSPVVTMLAREVPVREVAPLPLTLRGLVARLRLALTSDGRLPEWMRRERTDAPAALALLAAEGVPGADPQNWRGLAPLSTEEPLLDLTDPETRVAVSPSKLETLARSPMEWFVASYAGGQTSLAAGFGTLVHEVLEHAVEPEQQTAEAMWAALEQRWPELEFESPWIAEQQRRAARSAVEALAAYLRMQRAEGVVLLSSEPSFELDEAPALLRGKIDRVESHDGAIVIVDLKTGKPKSQAYVDDNPQLAAYQLAYARGQIDGLPEEHRPGGARMLYTRDGGAKAPYKVLDQAVLTPEQLAEFAQTVREAAITMAGAAFPAVQIDDPYAYGGEVRVVHLPGEVSGD